MKQNRRRAFTLIEMLVVVVVIAILIGIVFRMIAIFMRYGDRANSMATVQRVANAVEGFHAEYGQYPPAPYYDGRQQFRYEYPNRGNMQNHIILAIQHDTGWGSARLFTFGLMSFLVNRTGYASNVPSRFFNNIQWVRYNDSASVSARDRDAVRRWAPHLDGLTVTADAGRSFQGRYYTNNYVTVRDAWGSELRYESPTPHQRYRVWTTEPGTGRELGSGNWDS